MKDAKDLSDEAFHEFVEKLGVNVHKAESYVYSLAQEHLRNM